MTVLDVVNPSTRNRSADSSASLLDALVEARSSGSAQRVDSAETAIILEFLPQAARVAQRQRGRGVDLDDLVQIARVGLIKAVRGWKPQPDGGFMQYAGPMMLGEIQRHIRDRASLIRLSRRVNDLRPTIWTARIAAERDGRTPTDAELAHDAGVSVEDVREDAVSHGRSHPESIHAVPNIDDRSEFTCLRAESDRRTIEDRDALRLAIAQLTDRQRNLLALRFFDDRTQQDIARMVGLSQMQISRLLRAVLHQLRTSLQADEPSPPAA